MIDPVFAGMVYQWPDRIAILSTIALLAYVCVYRKARRADGRLPLGSLIFCGSLFLGSLLDMVRGPSVDFTWLGLISGAIAGGFVGLIRLCIPPGKLTRPPIPAGVWDRELDR